MCAALNLNDIQGDILVGLQKKAQIFAFFTIADVPAFKALLKGSLLTRLTTAQVALDREVQVKQPIPIPIPPIPVPIPIPVPVPIPDPGPLHAHAAELKISPNAPRQFAAFKDVASVATEPVGNIQDQFNNTKAVDLRPIPFLLSLPGLNLAFTPGGIAKLNKPKPTVGGLAAAASARRAAVNDPTPNTTDPTLAAINTDQVDGVFLLTNGSTPLVSIDFKNLRALLGTTVHLLPEIDGVTRPGAQSGHEHFGFLDGVSQPAIKDFDTHIAPGQDVLSSDHFVFPQSAGTMLSNGSLMVFRKIRQFVPEWNGFVVTTANANGMGSNPELAAARMVGRWQNGTPLALSPLSNALPAGSSIDDFNFGTADPNEIKCPFAAHIRKANPRDDFDTPTHQNTRPSNVTPHRMMRRGIPYGPEVTQQEAAAGHTQLDRGLLFVSYQTDITAQFEFVQQTWLNSPSFVFGKTDVHHAPITPGGDPVVALGPAKSFDITVGTNTSGNHAKATRPVDFSTPDATCYLLMPSLTALKTVLAA